MYTQVVNVKPIKEKNSRPSRIHFEIKYYSFDSYSLEMNLQQKNHDKEAWSMNHKSTANWGHCTILGAILNKTGKQ